jgi:hypothetical protein
MEVLANNIEPQFCQQKIIFKYYCNICDYGTCRKCNYDTHIISMKHCNNETMVQKNQLRKQIQQKSAKFSNHTIYTCRNCNIQFKSRSGLWKHTKKCCQNNNENNDENDDDKTYMYQGINIRDKDALVLHLLKQNGELQNKILEMASQTNITNHNNNSHNTTNIDKCFNLNLFLNETCKNAMNITDFVSSIKMNLDDLETTGRTGYIEGISNIILKNLNKLEQPLRPLHCSDLKREVLYIKDNNEWTKETEEKPILTKAIKTIANENIKQINKWKEKYPDCTKADSKKNDLYLKIVSNSMNGITKEEGYKNINKIISNVAKKVIIEK